MVAGTTISAIAMTEPGAGSDLQGLKTIARRDGNGWRLSVAARPTLPTARPPTWSSSAARTTEEGGARGFSLFLVEAGDDGFCRGRNLDKIGLHGNDTSELFFDGSTFPQTACSGPRMPASPC